LTPIFRRSMVPALFSRTTMRDLHVVRPEGSVLDSGRDASRAGLVADTAQSGYSERLNRLIPQGPDWSSRAETGQPPAQAHHPLEILRLPSLTPADTTPLRVVQLALILVW